LAKILISENLGSDYKSYLPFTIHMVKITHTPRLPSLRDFMEPWFDNNGNFPIPKAFEPWFRMDPFREMERAWDNYLSFAQNTMKELPESLQRFPVAVTCDMIDKGDKFILTADLPGINKDEVEVNILDNQIEISAEHSKSEEEKDKDFVRSERSQVRYQRTLSIPEDIVSSKVTAKMLNGVLTVELPKKTPTEPREKKSVKVE
jgi:HSP20 family protein